MDKKEEELFYKDLAERMVQYMANAYKEYTVCIVENDFDHEPNTSIEYDLYVYRNGELGKDCAAGLKSYTELFKHLISIVPLKSDTDIFIKKDMSLEEIELQLSIRGY